MIFTTGTLVPKLTLSVRNGNKLKDWVFGIPAHPESIIKTITNILLNMTKTAIPDFKLLKKSKL